jgi:LPS sulfotransferase NodH
MVARANVPFLRLSYKQLEETPDSAVIARISKNLGLPLPDGDPVHEVGHERLAGARSLEFAERFRHEYPRLMKKLDRKRVARLSALDKL